jgi:hypothetical protein
MSRNRFLALPEEGPFLHSASLRVLRLSDCDLRRIPPKAFEKVPNLEELYISHNRIEILRPLQGTGSLTLIDLSNNYLTALDSALFTASPKVHRLNLSYNRLSKLDIIPHLPNTTSSEELNGNPWVCNCNAFHMAYSWCRNNSVDLKVSCSSPPKFKDSLWTVWSEECCGDDNDCVDELGDSEIVNYMSLRRHTSKSSEIRQAPLYNHSKIQDNLDENVHHNFYMPFIIALSVLCFCGITVAGVMWCYLRYIRSKHFSPGHSDVEVCDL